MADSKHEETFKVIDRRPFTAEGELRKDVVEAEERRETEVAEKIAASKDAAAKSDAARLIAAGAGTDDASVATPAENAELPASSRSFQMLIDFLARNAAAMLGGMSDPRTGQPFLDIEGAREMIDMLDVLREKTRGNLAAEDDQLLLEVIGSLKLSFMEISKAAAAAMAEKARGKAK
ncbi:MAG: DUF1844 domain-containing protein [Candidatus Acidiferrales bacterium]